MLPAELKILEIHVSLVIFSETIIAWKHAFENTEARIVFFLSQQFGQITWNCAYVMIIKCMQKRLRGTYKATYFAALFVLLLMENKKLELFFQAVF